MATNQPNDDQKANSQPKKSDKKDDKDKKTSHYGTIQKSMEPDAKWKKHEK